MTKGQRLMQKYNAKIVGFKWSNDKPSEYYPIFEYKDENGETQQYVRRRGVEKDPFVMNRKYTIYKKDGHCYEKTERSTDSCVYYLIFRLIAMCIMMLTPLISIYMAIVVTLSQIIYLLVPIISRDLDKSVVYRGIRVEGKIAGTHKERDIRLLSGGKSMYAPIIEYVHNDMVYTHVSSVRSENDIYRLGQPCTVYIDADRKKVIDEMEVAQPVIFPLSETEFGPIINKITGKYNSAREKMTERVIERNEKKIPMSDTIELSPLKTVVLEKSGPYGWY